MCEKCGMEFWIEMLVTNGVRYYKTVQEAIAAANPSMRSFLYPQPGVKDAAKALVGELGGLGRQGLDVENSATMQDILGCLKDFSKKHTEELKLLNVLEKCLKYLAKGELGEVMFKTKLKQDKEFAEVLKGVGFQV